MREQTSREKAAGANKIAEFREQYLNSSSCSREKVIPLCLYAPDTLCLYAPDTIAN